MARGHSRALHAHAGRGLGCQARQRQDRARARIHAGAAREHQHARRRVHRRAHQARDHRSCDAGPSASRDQDDGPARELGQPALAGQQRRRGPGAQPVRAHVPAQGSRSEVSGPRGGPTEAGRTRARRTVVLAKPLRDRIRAGHPWLYDRALGPLPAGVAAGEVVTIADREGEVALAFVDPDAPIRARIVAPAGTALDAAWSRGRAEAAALRRARDPLLDGCTGRRLVHGEADSCPGLVIDLYATTAVVVFDGHAAAVFWRPRLSDVLASLEQGGATIAHAWLRGQRRRTGGAGNAGEAVRGAPPAEL